MNLSMKYTHRHRKQTCGCQGGGGSRWFANDHIDNG